MAKIEEVITGPEAEIILQGNHTIQCLNQWLHKNSNKLFEHPNAENKDYVVITNCLAEKIHYFEYIVNNLLPNLDENKEKSLLESFVKALSSSTQTGEC